MLDWIVIGGGIQGTTMAHFLVQMRKVPIEKLAIVDPQKAPLENWHSCTEKIDMTFLRSPSVHHLDVEPFSLQKFVSKNRSLNKQDFYGRYKRPSLYAFSEHCRHLIRDSNLLQAWHKGRVVSLSRRKKHWMVITEEGKKLEGLNVVLAIGVSEQTYWPEWAKLLKNKDTQSVGHIFDSSFSFNESQEITIVGGGISAAHLAIKLSKQGRSVHLITRHPLRIIDFDSDPAWLGPKNQLRFREEASYQKRRSFITDARHRGSMPRDIYIKLMEQTRKNNLTISKDEIQEANIKETKIILHGKTTQYKTETIVLATGFSSSLPGKEWLTPLINTENLQCSDCGYPIVSSSLQWSNNLYVVGALAELEIGPISRNISGARQAAEQIVQSL